MTQQAKFTPGPWEFIVGHASDDATVIMSERDEYIGLAGLNNERAAANARLIAAAPDLLESLQAACRDADYGLEDGDSFPPWYETARAAIAKATGSA